MPDVADDPAKATGLPATYAGRFLIVSPHLDDAVLSAGATLAMLASSRNTLPVATVFAGLPEGPLSGVAKAFHNDCGQSDNAIAERRDEDKAAMAVLGAEPVHLGFLDAVYRRRSDGEWLCDHDRAMFTVDPIQETVLYTEIAASLFEIVERTRPDALLTCAAIGGHVDHVLTRKASALAAQKAGVGLLLWEDLPYGIGQRSPVSDATRWRPSLSMESWTVKWQAISCYPSQLRMLWPNPLSWRGELYEHARSRATGRGDLLAELIWEEPIW